MFRHPEWSEGPAFITILPGADSDSHRGTKGQLVRASCQGAVRVARGFTLFEVMVALAVLSIISAVASITLIPTLRNTHVNNAYDTVLMALRQARELAVAQNTIYLVTLNAYPSGSPPANMPWCPVARTVTVTQILNNNGTYSNGPVLLTTCLPTDVAFDAESGIPSTAATTPDGLGTGASSGAIDFDVGVASPGTNTVYFWPDGSSRDANGVFNSGVVYLALPGNLNSSRAITVLGATGRIRGWQLVNGAWVRR